jgi:hypothetical protein
MFAATLDRVTTHTTPEVNAEIDRTTRENVIRYAQHREQIDRRLAELEEEWDIERLLETNYTAINLIGFALGATVDRRWYLLPAIAGGFMLMHALQGWCPPVPVLRRLGYRTAAEIDEERYALKALRGDFNAIEDTAPNDQPTKALRAAQAR